MPRDVMGARELARDASDGHETPDDGHEPFYPAAPSSTLDMSSPKIPVLLTFLQAMRGGSMQFTQVFFFFTLVTGPRRSLSLKLSDARVYEPQIRARNQVVHSVQARGRST